MFYSMGNLIGTTCRHAVSFSFETPHRVRLQGLASVDDNDPLLTTTRGAADRPGRRDRDLPQLSALRAPLRQGRGVEVRAARGVRDPDRAMEARRRHPDAAVREGPRRVARDGGAISRAEYESYTAKIVGAK